MNNKLKLIVLQPTSFCNLNCRYCYVPDRRDKERVSAAVLEKSIELAVNSDLIDKECEFLFHAGEPMTVGMEFYRKTALLIDKHNNDSKKFHKVIQTNATLVNEEWCSLFQKYRYKLGVSIDGPEFLHNLNRKNWAK